METTQQFPERKRDRQLQDVFIFITINPFSVIDLSFIKYIIFLEAYPKGLQGTDREKQVKDSFLMMTICYKIHAQTADILYCLWSLFCKSV